MDYIIFDVKCLTCGYVEEIWLERRNKKEILPKCSQCGNKVVRILGSNPTKCHDPAVRSEILKKRSEDHSRREFKNNVERVISKNPTAFKGR